MEISLSKTSETEGIIKVSLKGEDYQPAVDQKIKEYSKKVTLKGFRPGKVPLGLVRKMYGTSIKAEEINQLLSHKLMDYIRENDIKVLGEPIPNQEQHANLDWENQTEFELEYNIGMHTEFETNLSESIKVDRYQVTVDNEEIDDMIANLRKQNGEKEDHDEVKEGDDVSMLISDGAGEEIGRKTISLEEDVLSQEFLAKLIGLKKGDEFEIAPQGISSEEDYVRYLLGEKHDTIVEQSDNIKVAVDESWAMLPAELNQELFDKAFGANMVTTEEELRAKFEENLDQEAQSAALHRLNLKVKETLLESISIEIPEEFMKNWLIATNESNLTKEQIDNDFHHYVKDLKWQLIVNKIARDHEVKVEHEDVMNAAKELIKQQFLMYGAGTGFPDEQLNEFADNYLKGQEGKNYQDTYRKVESEKIMDFIKSKISIEEKEISLKEFRNLPMN